MGLVGDGERGETRGEGVDGVGGEGVKVGRGWAEGAAWGGGRYRVSWLEALSAGLSTSTFNLTISLSCYHIIIILLLVYHIIIIIIVVVVVVNIKP